MGKGVVVGLQVSVWRPTKRTAKTKQYATAKAKKYANRNVQVIDFSLTIETIAKIIDPDAWAETPSPSREKLTTDLASAKETIAGLRDEINWLDTVPTTPEGEYQRVRSESRRQKRFMGDAALRRLVQEVIELDEAAVIKRRQDALAKATIIMANCTKVLGRRHKLTVIQGEDRRRKYNPMKV